MEGCKIRFATKKIERCFFREEFAGTEAFEDRNRTFWDALKRQREEPRFPEAKYPYQVYFCLLVSGVDETALQEEDFLGVPPLPVVKVEQSEGEEGTPLVPGACEACDEAGTVLCP